MNEKSMKNINYLTKEIMLCGLLFLSYANILFANPEYSVELKRFEKAVLQMRENAEKIESLRNSGKVIGSERGLLDPASNANLSTNEQILLDQENKNRSIYFIFLARNSSSIYQQEKPLKPDNSRVTYLQIAQYIAKKWKEWPPKQ